MDLLTVDFETYYDKDYTLRKLTCEEYIRDPRFEVILVSVAVNREEPRWTTGTKAQIKAWLMQFNWSNSIVVGHNLAEFDGLILTEHFGIRAKVWQCTLAIARALGADRKNNSLAALARLYGLPDKGDEVHNVAGMRREDFSREQMNAYAEYCCHDVFLCRTLYLIFIGTLPNTERYVVHWFCRMYCEPRLAVDGELVKRVADYTAMRKQLLLDSVARSMGCTSTDQVQKVLRSDAKFAEYLQSLGVKPEQKLSVKKSKTAGYDVFTWAFAKTDKFMEELLEDEDDEIATVAAARVGVKTTIKESRLLRFVGISQRGLMPAPYAYGKTHTHRAAGAGKINLQNMGRTEQVVNVGRNRTPIGAPVMLSDTVCTLRALHPSLPYAKIEMPDGSIKQVKSKDIHVANLRDCIIAPDGYKVVVVDSAAIELRVGHMFAGQMDTIDAILAGVNLYESFAEDLYGYPVNKHDHPVERQHGKVGMLQLQYQSAWAAFQRAARIIAGVILTDEQAQETVALYRSKFQRVKAMWWRCNDMIEHMYSGQEEYIDQWGLCYTSENKIVLPNGLEIKYHGLRREKKEDGSGMEWVYLDKETRMKKRLYGGMVFENICQALARLIVFEQSIDVEKRWGRNPDTGVVLTSHDEAGTIVRAPDAPACLADMLRIMATSPTWWPGIPLACEGNIAQRYGAAK